MTATYTATGGHDGRVDWVDYAKGFCIVFVVMMHATYGVEAALGQQGFMHPLVEFMTPFRIPDFFLLSGLFVGRVIDRDLRTYLDRKVVHFVYFLLLWSAIIFLVKGLLFGDASLRELPMALAMAFIEPFGTLWFIHMLPIFFIVARLTRRLPMPLVLGVAAVLEIAHIDTGYFVVDQFCARIVYFLAGYYACRQVFQLAAWAQGHVRLALAGLAAWAVMEALAVHFGISALPVVSLVLGMAGAMAVVAASALMAGRDVFAPLRYCGRNTLVIYLAFFLFMATSRVALIKLGLVTDAGWLSVIVTLIAVTGPLLLHLAVKNTPARYLFVRPEAFKLVPGRPKLQPAE
ncbi:acyltransferase family protein [Blastochloris tepida]|uniref:Acyltransferase n=1 Tax=Blastochloris tepida TaxID=2233851 RepID=A0A348G4J0_9HYPH|nr:acyltransferase family protein [Blastochloris tepida]BBF94473.1 acyltransferase [Blastochloris tepida]